ncbi:MAG: excinuclease ABC subunit UvrC [Lachnospiraceae bacterium]|nr:excinuclease ABC subunit UvrC [Lachnospiraceae bacterium]
MNEDTFDIGEELKKIPDKPGVYIMHDASDAILYVGKAVNLKNRVRQYFQNRPRSPKIARMISLIHHFEYIVVGSEVEALVLECNLIKENHPKYNTMLMDDKTYPFIKVTVYEDFPRVYLTRHHVNDGGKYFGPYTSVESARNTLDLLKKIYRVRYCRKVIVAFGEGGGKQPGQSKDDIKAAGYIAADEGETLHDGREQDSVKGEGTATGKPCLYYHMHQCDAPCAGKISKEEYGESIDKILQFLEGNMRPVKKELEAKMLEASENMEFEKAIEFRDILADIDKMNQVQRVTGSDEGNRDVIGAAVKGDAAVVQVFFIRSGRLVGREHYYMGGDTGENIINEILNEFVKQFYAGVPVIPKEILLSEEIEEAGLIEEWLSEKAGFKVNIKFPKRGDKEGLIKLACSNAAGVLERDAERLQSEQKRSTGAVKELADLLGIEPPVRIEAYDISHISGFETVGSMVVYENGKPKRSDYRKFKIRTVIGPDDYASLAEVLTRRFEHGMTEISGKERSAPEIDKMTGVEETLTERPDISNNAEEDICETDLWRNSKELSSFAKFPDLIMMDGGKGQVNVALEVFEKLGIDQKVCGLVKDDNHRTRGIYYNNVEVPVDTGSEYFKFMTRVQDEVHRFAIEYHRKLRSKEQVHSILDDIKGVGPTRRRAIMKHFESLEAVRSASIEELAACESMNAASAKLVYDFFHANSN